MQKKEDQPTVERPRRCMLYSNKAPEGNIFVGAEAIKAALKKGWKDTPPEQFAKEASASEINDSDLALRLEEALLDYEGAQNEIRRLDTALNEANDRATEARATLGTETKRADAAEKKLEKAARKVADACE